MHLDPPWKLWKQPRSQSCLCMPSKPIADMARAIPATGASIVHLDIPWMLSSESQWRQHKSMDHWDARTGLRFQPSFLSHMTLGEELWFQPCLHMWKTHRYLCTPELRGGSQQAENMLRKRFLWPSIHAPLNSDAFFYDGPRLLPCTPPVVAIQLCSLQSFPSPLPRSVL